MIQRFILIKNSSFYKDSGEFKRAQERDRKKNNYCLSRGIRLVRIPYWELKGLTLEKILSSQKFVVKSMWHNDLLITKKIDFIHLMLLNE